MAHFSSVDINDGTNGKGTAVRCTSMKFSENGAGTYTGSLIVPANALLINCIVHAEVLWAAATSAALSCGDSGSATRIFNAINVKATDLLAAESIDLYGAGGKQGADVDDIAAPGSQIRNRQFTTTKTLQAQCVSVGAGTAGRTWVHWIWAFQPTADIVTVTQ